MISYIYIYILVRCGRLQPVVSFFLTGWSSHYEYTNDTTSLVNWQTLQTCHNMPEPGRFWHIMACLQGDYHLFCNTHAISRLYVDISCGVCILYPSFYGTYKHTTWPVWKLSWPVAGVCVYSNANSNSLLHRQWRHPTYAEQEVGNATACLLSKPEPSLWRPFT